MTTQSADEGFNKWWDSPITEISNTTKDFAYQAWQARDAKVAEKDRLLKVALEAMKIAYDNPQSADAFDALADATKAIKEAGK